MGLSRKIGQLLGNFTTHNGIVVLTYHRVNDKLPKDELVVDPKEFAKQMLFLNIYRNRFEVIGINEMVDWFNKQPTDKRTKILITFDDGYRDNYLYAFPILKKYKFQATIFLTTAYIGTDYKKPRYANVPWKRDYLKKDEIEEMMKGGISFGGHTKTHPHLTKISLEQAREEMVGSREYLNKIGTVPSTAKTTHWDSPYFIPFCYPHGDYNEDVKRLVKEAGFSCAFSVKPGINYAGQDLFEIKRIDVLGQDDFSSFKYKITDKYSVERLAYSMKTKILAYHSVGSATAEVGAGRYCVSVGEFRKQMRHLCGKIGTVPKGDCPYFTITLDDGDITNYTNAYPVLKEFGLKAHFFIIGTKVESFGYMNWKQIKELKDAGMIIGSHGMTHRILTELSDDELDYELRMSKELLEHNLGAYVDSLSIPRGFCSQKIIKKAREIGYKAIFTSDDRIVVKADWDIGRFVGVLNGEKTMGERFCEAAKKSSKRILGARIYDRVRTGLLK